MLSHVRRSSLMRALTIGLALGAMACGPSADPSHPAASSPAASSPAASNPAVSSPAVSSPVASSPAASSRWGRTAPSCSGARPRRWPATPSPSRSRRATPSPSTCTSRARGGGNLFYSPHSISMALAMLYGGARGDTERRWPGPALRAAPERAPPRLQPPGPGARTAAARAAGRGRQRLPPQGGQRHLGPEGLRVLARVPRPAGPELRAGLRVLDYIADPELARQTINTWVEDQTEDRIKELLPEGSDQRAHTAGADQRHLLQRGLGHRVRGRGHPRRTPSPSRTEPRCRCPPCAARWGPPSTATRASRPRPSPTTATSCPWW